LLAITVVAPLLGRSLSQVNERSVEWLDVCFAALLLFVAFRQAFNKTPADEASKKRAPRRHSIPRPHLPEYFGFGAIMIATDFSSLVLYLAALKVIGRAHVSTQEQVMVLVIPFVAVLLPALLPAVLGSLAPKTADRVLKPLAGWVGRNSRVIIIAVSLIFAAYLLIKAVPPLLR
jgi:uncharacterized membrane protein YfcA